MILLFDSGSIAGDKQSELRDYVTPFLASAAGPNRYVAILKWFAGLQVIQPFSIDPAVLAKSMENVVSGAELGQTGSAHNSPTVQNPSGASEDSIVRVRNMAATLRALAESLTPIRGRKDILYFSGGHPFPSETADAVDAMMAEFNKANVAVHGISSDGAWAGEYANRTGGTVIKFTNTMTEALNKLIEEQDAYYQITFSPAAGLETGCHQVKLKVVPGAFDVRSRKQYCAAQSRDPLAGTLAGKALEARAAGPAAGNMTASMQLPFFYTATDQVRVNLAVEIAPQGIKFQKRKGKLEADLNIVGIATREDGFEGPRFSDAVRLSFDKQEQVDAFLKTPFHYENQFQVAPGRYTVRVAFTAGDAFGKVETPLAVERRDASQLVVSALTFGRIRRDRPAGLAAGLDPSLLEGPPPLVWRGVQISPLGATRLRVTESAVIYTEICAPSGSGEAPSFQIRFVDRTSGAVRFGTDPASAAPYAPPGSQVFPIALDAPLKQLGPGAYRVELRAVSGPSVAIGGLDFDVN
jgi:VWFA-related protein